MSVGSALHEDFLSSTLPTLDLVYNLAGRLARDRTLIDDIVQETYVKAFEAWATGRKPTQVEPWIATICLNVGRGFWRKASTRREVFYDEVPEGPSRDDVEDEAVAHVQWEAIQRLMWQLPEEQRVTLTLLDVNGLSGREVAAIMDVPKGTVLSRTHRGRKRLVALIEKVSLNEKT